MVSQKERKQEAQQELQNYKVKKNARIISVLFWFVSSLYLYSTDVGFQEGENSEQILEEPNLLQKRQ